MIGGDGSDSGQANNPPSAPPRPAPTPAPTNQYSSAAYVDSQGREFGQTYSSDPNQKPTQVDKITDVAGYGDQGGGGGGGGNKTLTFVAATPAAAVLGGGAEVASVLGTPVAATPSTTYITPTLEDQATALGISTINNDRYMSDEAFAQHLQRKIDLENRNRAFKEELRIKEEADAATPPPVVEDPSPEGVNDLFGTMMTDSSKYIDELKKGFTGAVTMGERDGPSLGGAQFTNEFRDYAKSMGYEIDRGLSPMDGPSFLVRPEGWTPDAFNAHIKTQEETAATAKTAAAVKAAEDKAVAEADAAEAARQVKIKDLEDQLSASQGLYGELQDKYGKTEEEYTGLKSNFEELFGNYGTLTGTYDEQKSAYDDLYGQYDTLESQLVDYNTQLADQKSNYESLLDEYTGLQGQYDTTTDEYGTLKDQFGTLDEQYQNQLGLYDTLQGDFSGLQGTLAEQQAAYETQKAAAEKNRVLGIAEKATSGAAKPDPRYTQTAQTATPAYTPVAANQGAQSLTPGATPYGITPIDYAANMPDFMNNPLDLSIPSFGATGQNAPPPIGGPMQQLTPMMDYSAPFQPYLQSINQQYGVNIPSAYTGIMAGGRQ
jgi:predicted  nucleic acid-binding Zn-ribbon protein